MEQAHSFSRQPHKAPDYVT